MTLPYHYKRGPKTAKAVRDNPEHRLQKSFKQWLTYVLPDDVEWGSTLNGVYLSPMQREKAKATGFRAGALDMFFIIRQRTYWVETKAGTSLSVDQKRFISRLHPDAWAVVHSIEELEAALVRFGVKLKPYVWA